MEILHLFVADVGELIDVLYRNIEHRDAEVHVLAVVLDSRQVCHELSVPVLLIAEYQCILVSELVLLLILAGLLNLFLYPLELGVVLVQEIQDSLLFHLLLLLVGRCFVLQVRGLLLEFFELSLGFLSIDVPRVEACLVPEKHSCALKRLHIVLIFASELLKSRPADRLFFAENFIGDFGTELLCCLLEELQVTRAVDSVHVAYPLHYLDQAPRSELHYVVECILEALSHDLSGHFLVIAGHGLHLCDQLHKRANFLGQSAFTAHDTVGRELPEHYPVPRRLCLLVHEELGAEEFR